MLTQTNPNAIQMANRLFRRQPFVITDRMSKNQKKALDHQNKSILKKTIDRWHRKNELFCVTELVTVVGCWKRLLSIDLLSVFGNVPLSHIIYGEIIEKCNFIYSVFVI